MYRMSDYNIIDGGVPKATRKINSIKILKQKNKFCLFLYSQEIIQRNNFCKELSKYKSVDSPGRCMNNMPSIGHGTAKKSRAAQNWVQEKLDFMENYKFTIAFENFSKSGWVTEKLTHPFLINSVPIYFGHKNVKKEFNPKSFINSNDFKSVRELIIHIEKVDKNDKLYLNYLKESPYPLGKKIKYMDDSRVLKRLTEIFS